MIKIVCIHSNVFCIKIFKAAFLLSCVGNVKCDDCFFSKPVTIQIDMWGQEGTNKPKDDRSVQNAVSMPDLITEQWEALYTTYQLYGDLHI